MASSFFDSLMAENNANKLIKAFKVISFISYTLIRKKRDCFKSLRCFHSERPLIIFGNTMTMTESYIRGVISTRQLVGGEISFNKQISPIVEMTIKLDSVIGSVVEKSIHVKNRCISHGDSN